jgi:hypothetical protein
MHPLMNPLRAYKSSNNSRDGDKILRRYLQGKLLDEIRIHMDKYVDNEMSIYNDARNRTPHDIIDIFYIQYGDLKYDDVRVYNRKVYINFGPTINVEEYDWDLQITINCLFKIKTKIIFSMKEYYRYCNHNSIIIKHNISSNISKLEDKIHKLNTPVNGCPNKSSVIKIIGFGKYFEKRLRRYLVKHF